MNNGIFEECSVDLDGKLVPLEVSNSIEKDDEGLSAVARGEVSNPRN